MPSDRRARDQAGRRALIIENARELADAEGWDAVTTRRLAASIEFSQPVLYSHFPGGTAQIRDAVGLEGRRAMVESMTRAPDNASDRARNRALVVGYLDFAAAQPAVYAAMFDRSVVSATAGPRSVLDVIAAALRRRSIPPRDIETAAELLWAALHGLATLTQAGHLRPSARKRRIDELVDLFAVGG